MPHYSSRSDASLSRIFIYVLAVTFLQHVVGLWFRLALTWEKGREKKRLKRWKKNAWQQLANTPRTLNSSTSTPFFTAVSYCSPAWTTSSPGSDPSCTDDLSKSLFSPPSFTTSGRARVSTGKTEHDQLGPASCFKDNWMLPLHTFNWWK